MRGYFEVGIYHPKSEQNIGTLWRSAYQLGAAGLFVIGRRYRRQPSDTYNAVLHTPLREYLTLDEMLAHRPVHAVLVGVEMGRTPLRTFIHPAQAIYLLGAEDHGLPPEILSRCNQVVSLESVGQASYNVAVAGSIVLYHRTFLQSGLVRGSHD